MSASFCTDSSRPSLGRRLRRRLGGRSGGGDREASNVDLSIAVGVVERTGELVESRRRLRFWGGFSAPFKPCGQHFNWDDDQGPLWVFGPSNVNLVTDLQADLVH